MKFTARPPLLPGAVAAFSFLVLGALTALGLLHGWLDGAGIATAGREAARRYFSNGSICLKAAASLRPSSS